MLRLRDDQGKPRKPATPDAVEKALVGAKIAEVVVKEWVNEAWRRNECLGSEEVAGRDFREIRNVKRAEVYRLQDVTFKVDTLAIGYRPGIIARALHKLAGVFHARRLRRIQRQSRKRNRQ